MTIWNDISRKLISYDDYKDYYLPSGFRWPTFKEARALWEEGASPRIWYWPVECWDTSPKFVRLVKVETAKQGESQNDCLQPRPELLDPITLLEMASVYAYGAKKHGELDYQKHEQVYFIGKILRHTFRWIGGQKTDESGFSHLIHAMVCMMMLLWVDRNGVRKSD